LPHAPIVRPAAVGGTVPTWAVDDLASITCHNKADSAYPHGASSSFSVVLREGLAAV
jgi:hypothetical protein